MAYVSNTDPAIKRLQKQGVTTSGASSSASSGASAASTSKSSNTGTKTAYVSSTDPAIRRLRGESVYTSSSDSLAVNKKDDEKNTAKKTSAQSIASNKGSQTTGGTFLGGWKQPEAKEKKTPTAAEIAAQQKEAEEAAKRLSYLETLDLDEQQKKIDALTAEAKKGAKLNVHAFGAYDPNNLTETEMALAEAQEDYNLAKSLQYSAKGKKALEALDLGAQRLVDTVAKYNIEARGLRSSDMPTEAERETALKGLLSRGMTMEEIEQLADYRARQLNEQEYDAKVRKMQELASRDDLLGISDMGAVAASIASIPLNLGSGAGYLDLLMQKAHNKQMGYDRPLDYKTGAMSLYGQASAARETVSQGIMDNADTELGGQVGSFLYQTGMSMADSAVVAGLGVLGLGASGTLLLGGSAATAAAVDAKNRGGSDSQALWSGALAGAAETVFEKVSLDNLLTGKLTKNFVGGEFKKLLADVGVQGAVEGSEELFTAFANHITDRAVMGGSSTYYKSIREYMAAGMTAEEAKAKATADFAAECATSFVGGVLSGGVMGGVANAARYSYGAQGLQTTRKTETGASGQGEVTALSETPMGEEAVKGFASTMDKAGATAMTRLYSPDQEPTAYIEGMMKAYNAGRSGAELNTVDGLDAITPAQAEGAYIAGQADAENASAEAEKKEKKKSKIGAFIDRVWPPEQEVEGGNVADAIFGSRYAGKKSPKNTLENTDSAAYTDTTKKEDVTNEQEGNASSSGGYGRASGVLAEGSGGSVQRGTGSAETRGETQRLRAESFRHHVQAAGVSKVNTASQGISTGTTRKTLQVVPSDLYTDEMREYSSAKAKNGTQVYFIVGELEMREDNRIYRARGAISADGKRIWLRVDHDELTWQMIAEHEDFHEKVLKDSKLKRDVAAQVIARYGYADLKKLVGEYEKKYGFTEMSEDDVVEEILADAYAGIDIFDYLTDYEGATRYSDVVRDTVKLSEKEKANPIRAPSEVKTSRESDRAFQGKFNGNVFADRGIKLSDAAKAAISSAILTGNARVTADGKHGRVTARGKVYLFDTFDDGDVSVVKTRNVGEANIHDSEFYEEVKHGADGQSGHQRAGENDGGSRGRAVHRRVDISRSTSEHAAVDRLDEGESDRQRGRDGGDGEDGGSEYVISDTYSPDYAYWRNAVKEPIDKVVAKTTVKTSRETDSEGKALTEEQAAYFADSKSVDAQGRLRVMYRGGGDFTVFDRKKSSYSNLYGRGFYFTDSKSHAEQYGGARAFYLNIKNPVPTDERTITKKQLLAFLRAVAENEDDYSFENYGYGATPESVADAIFSGKSDFAMLYDVSQTAIGDMVEAVELFNAINGTNFDGLILDTETVTFRSEQAKSVSNKKPTSDPDIRFSREAESIESMEQQLYSMEAEYQTLNAKRNEFQKSEQFANFMDAVRNLEGDELTAVLEEYAKWEKSSGFSGISKRMEGLRGEMKTLRGNLDRAKEEAAKAARENYRAQYNEEFAKKYASKAARKFKTTSRFNLAGYLTVNGSLLDFSEGQGYRVQDHREIAEVLDFLPEDHGYSDGLIEFMNMGNIRMQSYGIDIAKAPNKEQKSVLRRFFQSLNGEVTVDFSDENGNNVGSVEYSEGTRTDKILNEIERFYRTGDLPQQDSVSMFRYSREATYDELREQNATLQQQVEGYAAAVREAKKQKTKAEYWKGQTQRTKEPTVRQDDIDKLAKSLIKRFDGTTQVEDINGDLKALAEYIIRDGDGKDELTYRAVKDKAVQIARTIVNSAEVLVNDEAMSDYKAIKKYLRENKIAFDGKGQITDWADFIRRNKGRIIIAKNGTPIDMLWSEMGSRFGYSYFPSGLTSADKMLRIEDLLDDMEPIYENPFSRDMAEAIEFCANTLLDEVLSEAVRQSPPTFADKQAAKMQRVKWQEQDKAREAVRRVREDRDKKIAALKDRYTEAVKRVREERDEKITALKEHYKAKESKGRESRKARELREKIDRHVKDLRRQLLHPTDNQHIPEALRQPVANLLAAINMESSFGWEYDADGKRHRVPAGANAQATKRTEAFNALRTKYKAIADELVVDPDLVGSNGENGFFDDVIALGNKPIAAMNSAELETVWQALRAIESSVRTANKMFAAGRFQTVREAAEELRFDNGGKQAKVEYMGALDKAHRLVSLDMLTPEAYFHRLGESGDALFQSMRRAQDKYIQIMKTAADFTRTLKADVKNLEKESHTVKLGGQEVQMTTAQLMELYVMTRREQALGHIGTGGIMPESVRSKGLKKARKHEPVNGITLEELSKACSLLSAEQVEMAEKMQGYLSNEMSDYGNEASMQVYNYKKFTEKNYWPIRTNKNEVKSNVEKDTQVTSVANRGFTKAVKPNANTSVVIGSIFDTFARHTSEMATYAAWLGTTEDINRVRNFQFRDDEGNRTGTVKGLLDRVHGSQGGAYLQKLLSDISLGVRGNELEYMGGLVGNYKAAAVGANLRVIIQQPTAILRALDMIDPKYLVGGLKPNNGWKKALKYAPIAQWKDWGYFDINTGRQMKDVLFDNDTVLGKARQISMMGASKMDSLAWGQLWNACELETKAKHKDLKGEAFYKAVAKRFGENIDHTQVVDGVLQRSQIMRSSSGLTKMAVSFMGEPTKQYNMLLSAAYDAKTKGDKKTKQRLARAVFAFGISGVVNAMAQSIIDAVRDDDKEEKYWEKWLQAFTGFEGDEEGFGEHLKAFWNGNLEAIINPTQYIPYAKDVFSILQGYDVSRMDMESVEKTVSAAQNMLKALSGEGSYTIGMASANLFAEAGRLLGIPVANLKREIFSFAMQFAIQTDNYMMQYRMEKASKKMNSSTNKSSFMDILYSAYVNDKDAYEIIYADMIKEDAFKTTTETTAENIKSNMEKRMKKVQGVDDVRDLEQRFMPTEVQSRYDKALSGVASNSLWRSASAEHQSELKNDIYEIETGTVHGNNIRAIMDEANAAGLSDTEYLLYRLACDTVNEGSSNITQAEAEAAVLLLEDISREERAFLWQRTDKDWSEKNNPFK